MGQWDANSAYNSDVEQESSDVSVHYSPYEATTYTFKNNQFKRQSDETAEIEETSDEIRETEVENLESETRLERNRQSVRRKPKNQQRRKKQKKHQKKKQPPKKKKKKKKKS